MKVKICCSSSTETVKTTTPHGATLTPHSLRRRGFYSLRRRCCHLQLWNLQPRQINKSQYCWLYHIFSISKKPGSKRHASLVPLNAGAQRSEGPVFAELIQVHSYLIYCLNYFRQSQMAAQDVICMLSLLEEMISLTGGMNIISPDHGICPSLSSCLCQCAGGCRTPKGLCL